MNPVEIIARKRDGLELSAGEIEDFVQGFTRGEVPDYQASALAMAIYLRGMSEAETAALTEAMLRSGTTLSWSPGGPAKVDKHSTGGVGDKVSLVLAPLLAACGLAIPMISGRGLGPSGGTLDKLESIPGFRTDLSLGEIREITERVGCVITGATDDLAPADRKLYALRDVTATVASIPLITSSIMSKKLAESLDALVLDVKWGSGAFMKTKHEAERLAESLVTTGSRMGVPTRALVTDMNQPLGRAVGHAVELEEAIAALEGDGPDDLVELTLTLAAEALVLASAEPDVPAAVAKLRRALEAGAALDKFHEMIAAQGGDVSAPRPLAPAHEILAQRAGRITAIDAEQLGWAVVALGGGRRTAGEAIDHSVGLVMHARLGEKIERGQPLATVHAPSERLDRTRATVAAAVSIDEAAVPMTAPPANRPAG